MRRRPASLYHVIRGKENGAAAAGPIETACGRRRGICYRRRSITLCPARLPRRKRRGSAQGPVGYENMSKKNIDKKKLWRYCCEQKFIMEVSHASTALFPLDPPSAPGAGLFPATAPAGAAARGHADLGWARGPAPGRCRRLRAGVRRPLHGGLAAHPFPDAGRGPGNRRPRPGQRLGDPHRRGKCVFHHGAAPGDRRRSAPPTAGGWPMRPGDGSGPAPGKQ